MGASKKLRTPLIKPRKQGGTFYTFSSALEDVGLNINELKNKVALSHYVLLNIPAFRFEDINTGDPVQYGTDEDNFNQGDYTFAESFQNYVLNMETVIRNQSSYNFAESLTVSERVFWKYMKKIGFMNFVLDSSCDSSTQEYYVEDSSFDSSINSNCIVKGFGSITAGAQRTDAYGIYNETFVQIPSSYGRMKVLFKPVSDKNYHITSDVEDYFYSSDASGYIENISSSEIDTEDKLHTAIPAKGQFDIEVDGKNAYTVDSKDEELCVEFSLDALRTYYNDETLTYDDLGIESTGIPTELQTDSYDFNAILVYYSIYDSTGKNTLATNAYGLFILDSAKSIGDDSEIYYEFPSVQKKKTTTTSAGSSYAFRLNIKTSSVYSGDIIVNDESTAAYEMSTEFNDVVRNMAVAVDTLRSNANVIKVISSDNQTIKSLATKAIDKIDDLEKDIKNIKNGVSRSLKATSISTTTLDASSMEANVTFYSGDDTFGSIDGSTFTYSYAHIDNDLYAGSVETSNVKSSSISCANDGGINFTDESNRDNYAIISQDGIYSNGDVFIKSYNTSTSQDEVNYKSIVDPVFDKLKVSFDSISGFLMSFADSTNSSASDVINSLSFTRETTATIEDSDEDAEGSESSSEDINDESSQSSSTDTIQTKIGEGSEYYNLSYLVMLLLAEVKYLRNKCSVLDSSTDSSIDSSDGSTND